MSTKFAPSKYQQAIFDAYTSSNSNIVVNAAPGSGKTTTILQVLKLTPKSKNVIFLAFNKSIVQELAERVPEGIEVSTLHSLGMKSLARHYRGRLDIQAGKTVKIAKELAKRNRWQIAQEEEARYLYTISDLVDVYRLAMANGIEELRELAAKHDIFTFNGECEKAMEVITYLNHYNSNRTPLKGNRMIDFTDMIYIPATQNVQMNQYDEVFVDECQDLNQAQQIIVEKITKSTGRTICVGDKYQSIYSFMGADVESFEKLSKKPNTICLPLSVTYRCAQKIVDIANQVYNNVEAAPNAKEGEVRDGLISEAQDGDFVLCRNTAPLITVFYHFIGQGQKCHIKGKQLGKNLISMMKKLRSLSLNEALAELRGNLAQVAMELSQKGVQNVTSHPRYINHEEKISVIEEVAKRYSTTQQVITALENIFSDTETSGITLSTIHKSKGLEADRVFIIRRDLMPSKRATQPWQQEQERNLKYVAYTRAKSALVFATDVTDDGVKKQD